VDGNDPLAVWKAVTKAVDHARKGAGPTLVECKTVRWERHSAISAGKYDTDDEAQKWKKVDPIPRFAAWLKESGATDQQLEEARQTAFKSNQEALAFAKASAYPAPATLADYVYA
jgi:TPP-dependent pyruvate/acetoin dehydrogenase alpha subunit